MNYRSAETGLPQVPGARAIPLEEFAREPLSEDKGKGRLLILLRGFD